MSEERPIQPVRGMNDILPEQTPYWQQVEDTARSVLEGYGYREIRLPVLERTELFARSIGEATDIVEKEMYTFLDRNGESMTMRPEATAGCVRACISHGLLRHQQQRLWCAGPMFRYEKPQKGRYRQFHQIDVEALGFPGPDIDAELILASRRLWRRLGIDGLVLKLNSLGTPASREQYRQRLVEYLGKHRDELDEDSRRRLTKNPLRILDSKNPELQGLIADAPQLCDDLDDESAEHFAALRQMLDGAGVAYRLEPRLVRGLDYYTHTVFEWVSDRLGAQDAVCSGGRYDVLVEQLGGRPTPAVGWAMGIERAVALLEHSGRVSPAAIPHVYLVMVGERAARAGIGLAERLRDELPGLRLTSHCGGGSIRAQLRQADRSGAEVALILGDDEVVRGTAALKPLRSDAPQREFDWNDLTAELAALIDLERE